MQNFFFLALLATALFACQQNEVADTSAENSESMKLDYPDTRKGAIVDEHHGQSVADPYRWLEVDTAEEVKDWVKAENEVTFSYLENIPFRDEIRDRLEDLLDYERFSAPFKEGKYTYFSKNDGLQDQSVIYRQQGNDDVPEVFLDPNKFSGRWHHLSGWP